MINLLIMQIKLNMITTVLFKLNNTVVFMSQFKKKSTHGAAAFEITAIY